MTMQTFAAGAFDHRISLTETLASFVDRLSGRLAARRRFQTTRNELLAYSAEEIRELGISEADIDFVAEADARR